MVKDEEDVVADTIGEMRHKVDHVIVADNGSTDGTREILDSLDVEVIDDPEPAYYQSDKMSALARRATEAGATWIIPFDADEVWMGVHGLQQTLANLPREALIASAQLYDHVPTGRDPEGPPIRAIQWRRQQPAAFPKVAVRAREGLTIHQGNHGASFENVRHPLTVTGQLEIRHFPYRSPEQFIRKARNGAAAYAASDLPESAGAHWRNYGRILDEQGEDALREVFYKWFHRDDPNLPTEIDGERQGALVHDPALPL